MFITQSAAAMAIRMAHICVFLVAILICCDGLPFSSMKGRVKRHAHQGGDAISATLQIFTDKLHKLERDLDDQDYDMRRQKKKLDKLKYDLHSKADVEKFDVRRERLEELFETVKIIAKLPVVTEMGERLQNLTKRVNEVETKSRENKRVYGVIRSKIYTNRVRCRLTHTSWATRADAQVGGLSELNVACRPNEFIQEFLLDRENPRLNSKLRYRYYCCRYSFMIMD